MKSKSNVPTILAALLAIATFFGVSAVLEQRAEDQAQREQQVDAYKDALYGDTLSKLEDNLEPNVDPSQAIIDDQVFLTLLRDRLDSSYAQVAAMTLLPDGQDSVLFMADTACQSYSSAVTNKAQAQLLTMMTWEQAGQDSLLFSSETHFHNYLTTVFELRCPAMARYM